jgi:transposase InsO family protein
MARDDLAFLSAAETAEAIATKQVSPVDVVQAYLGRIERLDGHLHAYITVLRDQALAAARQADLVGRNFSPDRPNRLWVADYTYVSTWTQTMYVAFVVDCFSRFVVVLDTTEPTFRAADEREVLELGSDREVQAHSIVVLREEQAQPDPVLREERA